MMGKVKWKIGLDPDLADRVEQATARYSVGGRKVKRIEVIERLLEDGFRWWAREKQQVEGVEKTLALLLDQSKRHDRMLRTLLLNLAEGDAAEYQELLNKIERETRNGQAQ